MSPMTIKIKVGEAGAQFLQRNNLPAKGHIDKQPAGLNFYELNWNSNARGTVYFEHGPYSFQIPYALGIMGREDVDDLDAGLAKFNINSGMSSTSPILHDEARKEFSKLLQRLLALGWKPFFSYTSPRLTGAQAFQYFQENIYTFAPPVNYSPTLEQWLEIKRGYWQFYADDVFLEIKFRRGVESKDPTMAAYLFSFGLHSKEEEAKAQFEGEERDHWQELWVDKIKSMKKERYTKEKELIQRGFTIYTEYQEPKIHPADPVEP